MKRRDRTRVRDIYITIRAVAPHFWYCLMLLVCITQQRIVQQHCSKLYLLDSFFRFGISVRIHTHTKTCTHTSEKYTCYTVVSSCTLQQFSGLQNYYFLMILSFNKIVVFNPKSLIRVVYSMTKLLISHTTISLLTTNSTNYYQLTSYYVDKTKLLFIHRTTTFWYFAFHPSTLQFL